MEKARTISPVGVRIPPEICHWLKEQALANRRSLNSEIVVCLEEVRRMRETGQAVYAR